MVARTAVRKGTIAIVGALVLAVGATVLAIGSHNVAGASGTFEQYAANSGMYFSSAPTAATTSTSRETAIADAEKTVAFPGATVTAGLYEYHGQAMQIATNRLVWVVTYSGNGVASGSWGPVQHVYHIVHVVIDAETGQTLFSFPGDA